MTELQKKDLGYDKNNKKDKVKDKKKLDKNKIKNSLKNNNSSGSNGMHNNNNNNNVIPLTKEHYIFIGEPRGKKSDENPRVYSKSQNKLFNALVMIHNKPTNDNNNIRNNNDNNINGPFYLWGNPSSAPYQNGNTTASFTMAAETGYRSDTMLRFMADHGYQIELTPPRDKHAGGIAERMVGIVTAKTNNAMLENGAPPSFWCWAMFKTTQDLNFNYSKKIDTSPSNYITGHHIDIKYLHSFFAVCYMHIPLKDRTSKLPARRAQRCRCDKQRYYLDLAKSRDRIGSIASQQCLYQLSILCK